MVDRSEFSEVEKRILEHAASGKDAEFGRDQDGNRPTVSAQFLADLWLDRIADHDLHPMGIAIKGLKITGALSLGGAKQTSKGRQCLLGFHAIDCEFEEPVNLSNTRCESIFFTRCRFDAGGNGALRVSSLMMSNAEIDGALGIVGCEFATDINAQDIRVGGDLSFDRTKLGGGLDLWGADIRGALLLTRVGLSVAGAGPEGQATIRLTFAHVAGFANLFRINCQGGIFAKNLHAGEANIRNCLIGDETSDSSFDCASIRGEIAIVRSRFSGNFHADTCEVGAALMISNCRFGNLAINSSNIHGEIFVFKTIVRSTHSQGQFALDNTTTAAIYVKQSYFDIASFDTVDAGSKFDFTQCRVGKRRHSDEEVLEFRTFSARGLQTKGSFHVHASAIYGRFEMPMSSISDCALFTASLFSTTPAYFSLDLAGGAVKNILIIKDNFISSGAEFPILTVAEIQFDGNVIQPFRPSENSSPQCIWASDCKIERRVSFGKDVLTRQSERRNILDGVIDFSSSQIGERFLFRSAHLMRLAEAQANKVGQALDLSRLSVGGDVVIGASGFAHRDEYQFTDLGPVIDGCINLDDATISGDLVVDDCRINARGDVTRPSSDFKSEERVSKRKRGVALSLRDATISGELEIGRPMITGLVDLRDARIGLIADGGGARWSAAGLEPGQLLLDGLVYRDLDEIEDEGHSPHRRWLRTRPNPIKQRLAWLRMQYPRDQVNAVTFVPQPYEQLASIFASEGNDHGRRKVIIEKRNLTRKYGRLGGPERLMQQILRITSQYGYSSGWALFWTTLYIALGTVTALIMQDHNGTGSPGFMLASTDSEPSIVFNPLVYAIDVAMPLIDLKHDGLWTPDPEIFGGHWQTQAILIAKAVYQIIGMLLVSITILTLTGTLREKE